jgi:hypothetical protein
MACLDIRMPVTEHVQAEAHGGVEVAVAVGVPDVGTLAAVNEDRVRHLQVGSEAGIEDLGPLAGDGLGARRLCLQLLPRLRDLGHRPASFATTGANGSMASSPTVT